MPDLTTRRRYRAERNLPYGELGARNSLDVWHRADLPPDGRAPVLFQVHGGAWVTGSKEGQAEPLMGHLAERGWVCVAPNYRLSPRSSWPDHIVDVKRALAWTKANIAGHGGDPEFVVATGGSAGGHLSSLAALTPGLAEWQPGFEDADTSVVAAVPLYGVYDFTNRHGTSRDDMTPFLETRVFKSTVAEDRTRWEQASPLSHVGPDAPPFFVLHGTNDTLVPVEQARTFSDELRKSSNNPVVYAELPEPSTRSTVFPPSGPTTRCTPSNASWPSSAVSTEAPRPPRRSPRTPRRPDGMRRLRGQDAAFWYGETPSWHMHIGTLMVLDPTDAPDFGFPQFKKLLMDRLHIAPIFRWRIIDMPFGLDRPVFVESVPDPEYHIRRIAVPAPGGRKEVEELVSHMMGYKLDRTRPLWEMWFVEGLEGGRVGLFGKAHHAIVDGVSGAGLLEALLDLEPTPRQVSPEVVDPIEDEPMPSQVELLGAASSTPRCSPRTASPG